jgi:integrase
MSPAELSAEKPSWTVREATRLNDLEVRAVATEARQRKGGGRTVGALIRDYRLSTRWKRLRPATQRGYAENFKAIERKWGADLVGSFTKPVMHAWYETLYETNGKWAALNLLRAMSILMQHAELIGWRAENSNPCLRLGMEKPKGRAREATWAEIDACIAAARALGLASIDTALHLALYHGQRQTDVVRALPGDFERRVVALGDGGPQEVWVWSFERSKRGNAGVVPLHPDAVAVVLAARAAAAAGPGPIVWDEATGKPFTKELFFKRWDEVRAEAAKTEPSVATLQWRDLRRTFGRMARRAGTGRDDVADVLGNSADTDSYLAQVYTAAELATAARAVMAIRRPDPARTPSTSEERIQA